MNEKGLKIAVKGTLWKLKKAEDNESRVWEALLGSFPFYTLSLCLGRAAISLFHSLVQLWGFLQSVKNKQKHMKKYNATI